MNRARFNALYNGMTSVAKKVYEAVPLVESWNHTRVNAELVRLGVNIDHHVLRGCLETLRTAGLVNEVARGEFRREAIREPKRNNEKEPAPMKTPATAAKPAPASATPFDKLGNLAAALTQLAAQLEDLASDLTDAAIDIQAQLETNDADLGKLKQLQTLLKSLGMTGTPT